MVEYKCKKDKEQVLKTRKANTMRKNTIETMISYLNGETVDTAALRDELTNELKRLNAKADANRAAYDLAHAVVLSVMSEQPMTVKEIATACGDALPEGFSPSKIQYALLNYWSDEVVKIENAKSANQYRLA